jgi:hypothetical protein
MPTGSSGISGAEADMARHCADTKKYTWLVVTILGISVYSAIGMLYVHAVPFGATGHVPVVCCISEYEQSLSFYRGQFPDSSVWLLMVAQFRGTYEGMWHIYDPMLFLDNQLVHRGKWNPYFGGDEKRAPYGSTQYGEGPLAEFGEADLGKK